MLYVHGPPGHASGVSSKETSATEHSQVMDVFPRISLLARLYAIGFHSSVRIGDYGGQNCSVRFFRHARLFLVRCVAVHPHRRSFGGNQEHLEQRRPVLEIFFFFSHAKPLSTFSRHSTFYPALLALDFVFLIMNKCR